MSERLAAPHRLVVVCLAFSVVISLFAQIPHPAFSRLRSWDWFGAIPNWRFFAPNPAEHDLTVYVRRNDEPTTEWFRPRAIVPRRPLHAVWFPSRRADKAVFDLAADLLPLLRTGDRSRIESFGVFQVLRAWVESDLRAAHAPPGAYELALIKYAGSDEMVDPEVLYISNPFCFESDESEGKKP